MKLSGEMVEEALTETPPDTFVPTEHQQAIKDFVLHGKGSANVKAVAGSGKTTTLVWLCQFLSGSAVFTAYNKKIADEIAFRLQERRITHVQAKTFHAIGFASWKKLNQHCRVDGNKVRDICDDEDIPYNQQGSVSRLVSIAKNAGYELQGREKAPEQWWFDMIDHFDILADYPAEGDDDEVRYRLIEQAVKIIKISNEMGSDLIDFDDMIYLPLKYSTPFWKNDWVLVDELQDTNLTRRLLAERMLAPNGRFIGVGDPRQAIYGFTGADAQAMENVAKHFGCIDLPLTVSFRCPKAVVRHAQKIVSHIQAADNAPEGVVRQVSDFDWRSKEMTREFLDKDTVILCRYTKPLVSLAFECIRKSIPCHVEGKEIGKGLVSIIKKMRAQNLSDLSIALNEHLQKMSQKWRERRQEAKIEALADKIETIFVVMENIEADKAYSNPDTRTLISVIEGLFGDTEGGRSRDLTLSTVHKAKGREWDRVYLWGRDKFMPSSYAKQDWQLLQEENLIYVAVTRAKKELVEVTLGV